VHAGNDDNDVAIDAVEDPIRESMHERPSGISVNHRVDGRMSSNAFAHSLHSRQELIAQNRDAGARTIKMPPQYPQLPLDG